jgi:Protein of unknown function (DUF3572)
VKKNTARDHEAAEALALDALTFLAADAERLERFLALSGLSVDNLRAAAAAPDFLAGVLDYFAGDEPLLLAFAANAHHDPADIMRAWALLGAPPEDG